eukprot:Rmarinus@m.3163
MSSSRSRSRPTSPRFGSTRHAEDDVGSSEAQVRESKITFAPRSISQSRKSSLPFGGLHLVGCKIVDSVQELRQTKLAWLYPPKNVFVLKKHGEELVPHLEKVCRYLVSKGMNVFLEHTIKDSVDPNLPATYLDIDNISAAVDLAVCLGGDGLIIYVSSLFPQAMPPVLSFALGSLGFLTPYDYQDHERDIDDVLAGDCFVTLRMRLHCCLRKENEIRELPVLNEVVIDRGPSPYLCHLDIYCDGEFVTTCQGDGVIFATPTGSTAYSLAAGGSMIHPVVPAIVLTPICPHSLSFRPVVFPDYCELKVKVPENSRASAWASFDGKHRTELNCGEEIVIYTSEFPVPTVNKTNETRGWFESLSNLLLWNNRTVQKAFPKTSMQLLEDMSCDSESCEERKRECEKRRREREEIDAKAREENAARGSGDETVQRDTKASENKSK